MTTAAPPRRYPNQIRMPVSVALCAPAIRTVIVQVADCREHGGEVSHEFMPVLALRSAFFEIRTEGRGQADDWDSEDTPIVADPTYQLADLEMLGAVNVRNRVVACPWPAAEDEARLAPAVAELTAELMEARPGARSRA